MQLQIEKHYLQTTMASRRKKVSQHFEDLEQCYFSFRQTDSDTSGEYLFFLLLIYTYTHSLWIYPYSNSDDLYVYRKFKQIRLDIQI